MVQNPCLSGAVLLGPAGGHDGPGPLQAKLSTTTRTIICPIQQCICLTVTPEIKSYIKAFSFAVRYLLWS